MERAENINPSILAWARQSAGLSLEDAASKIGIQPSAVSFTTTMAMLSLALCFTRANSAVISTRMIPAAGRLTTPPAKGPRVNASGRTIPKETSALLK